MSIVYLVSTLPRSQLTTAVNGAYDMFDVSDAFMKTGMQQHRHRVASELSKSELHSAQAACSRHVCEYIRSKALVACFRSMYIRPLCNSTKPLWNSKGKGLRPLKLLAQCEL